MANITGLSGWNAQGWEEAEFPLVCETCLGPNPFVRMTKKPHGKECKICERPFTVFRWKPGQAYRYKSVQVCQNCAKSKNVCQVCLFDLAYGLPVQVRDQFLEDKGDTEVPQSIVSLNYKNQELDKQLALNGADWDGRKMKSGIQRIARTTPYYKRNRAHLCTYFARGECNRGEKCPYRHEMPEEGPLANQNYRDRFYGVNDPVANKPMGKYAKMPKPTPPDDETITTVWVGNVGGGTTDADLRDSFYPFGEIKSIDIRGRVAFVVYTTRPAAEAAVEALFDNLIVNGSKLRVDWAKPAQQSQPPPSASTGGRSESTPYGMPPARPTGYVGAPPLPGTQPPPPGSGGVGYYPSMDPRAQGAAAAAAGESARR